MMSGDERDRTLPDGDRQRRRQTHHSHQKFGPSREKGDTRDTREGVSF